MQFEINILSLYGQQGKRWFDSLPRLAEQLAKKWGLSNLQVLPNMSYNYVVGCMQGNVPAVLKIGFYKPKLQYEIQALKLFAGKGCVVLLDADIERGALLLQRAVPGTSLKTLFPEQDRQAADIASQVIKNLQCVTPRQLNGLPHVEDWLSMLDQNWNVPQRHLEKARVLKNQLLATTTQKVLLHGDLHHENILLRDDNSWVAIDPKGVIGDPVYEVGAPMRNPIPELAENCEVKKIIQNRVNLFAESLGFDRQRIFDWAFVQVVLGACWSLEDGLDPLYFFKMADVLMTCASSLK